MYGKFNEKGTLVTFSGKILLHNGRRISNPSEKTLIEAGYKPIVIPEEPTLGEGETLAINYKEREDKIEYVYSVVEKSNSEKRSNNL